METVQVRDNEKIGYRVIFKQKQYMKLTFASVINRFGDSIDVVAFMMLVYVLTKEPSWSAIMFAVNCIPTIILTPFVAGLVEGMNHKKVIVITEFLRGASVGVVAIAYAKEILNPWMLIVVTLIISTVESFSSPAYMAITPKVLEKKYYDFGISLKSSAGKVAELIGSAMAGIIIGTLGLPIAIGIDMVTYFLTAIIIATVRIEKEEKKKIKLDIKGYANLLKDGYRYIRTKKFICTLIIISPLMGALFIPFNTMLAPLVENVLGSSYVIISVISATLTIGMIISSVIYPYIAKKITGKMFVVISCVSCSVLYIGYVLVGTYIRNSVAVYVFIGVISLITSLGVTLVQSFVNIEFMKNVEPEYLARSGAVYNAIAMATTPIVSFLVGIIVKKVSVSMMFIGTGIFSLLCGMIIILSRLSFTEENE